MSANRGNTLKKIAAATGNKNIKKRGAGALIQRASSILNPNKKSWQQRRGAARRKAARWRSSAMKAGNYVPSNSKHRSAKFKVGQIAPCNYGSELKFVSVCDKIRSNQTAFNMNLNYQSPKWSQPSFSPSVKSVLMAVTTFVLNVTRTLNHFKTTASRRVLAFAMKHLSFEMPKQPQLS